MKKEVTAIFDIGKTNKKFFLFDVDFQEVYREYTSFDQIEDEDGYPTEDLKALQDWLKNVFQRILKNREFVITSINFSSYGSSLVHLDSKGEPLTPLYNYTKPFPENLADSFYKKYGPKSDFLKKTGSSYLGMLNSGLQLYRLKYERPELFDKIDRSLHLPQYLSYLFTGIPISEYTSIGCHTALWDFSKKDYQDWVYHEGIHKKLPPIVSTDTSINMNYGEKQIKIGVGIHDSSSALLPYVRNINKPFVLVSTGTWSIALNPFSNNLLTASEINEDCINLMRVDGRPIKASRLFLGYEYSHQVKELSKIYKLPEDYHKTVMFDYEIYYDIMKDYEPMFKWVAIKDENAPKKTTIKHLTFEVAYHQLMIELIQLQVAKIKMALGSCNAKRIYLDGGFTNNKVFIELLSLYLPEMKLRTTEASLGSALGAAIVISNTKLDSKFLKKNYSLKKHVSPILK